MTKHFKIALCILLGLSMAGCSSSSDDSKEEEETQSEEVVEEETQEETTVVEEVVESVVDPDFKAFMDEYEAIMNEYCDFMVKYQSADSTTMITMLADYTRMLDEYNEYAQKLDAYDPNTMSDADLAYYLEVTARVEQRLLETSSAIG